MRLDHAIAVTAAILLGFGVKHYSFRPRLLKRTQAAASLQMHSKGLPVQNVSDMSFVFSDD